MDVERRTEWLKQYDHEVVINPAESRLQVRITCTVYVNRIVPIFNCVDHSIDLQIKYNIVETCTVSIINTNKKGSLAFSLMVITSCVSVSNLMLIAFRFEGFFL